MNDYNKQFVNQLKAPSIELRKSSADIETEPILELGLLLDCTSSMGVWIETAKKTIDEMINRVVKECEKDGSLKCRVSFIGYRVINDERRFELMPFNDQIDDVKSFISEVKVESGSNNIPGDMLGGLKICLQ